MNCDVLRKMRYQDTYIYVMRYKNFFQYLFAYRNEVYQQNVQARPQWWRRILSPFGVAKYSEEQLDGIEQAILSGAMASLDKLISNKKIIKPAIDAIPLNK